MWIMRKYSRIFELICGYAHPFASMRIGKIWRMTIPSFYTALMSSIDLLFAPQESHRQAGLASFLQRKWSQTTASRWLYCCSFIKGMIGMKTWWIDIWQRSTQVETPRSHSICVTTCDSQGAFDNCKRSDLKSNIQAGCLGRYSLYCAAA